MAESENQSNIPYSREFDDRAMAQVKITDSVIKSYQMVREAIIGREHSYAALLKREGEEIGEEIDMPKSLLMFIESRFGQPSE